MDFSAAREQVRLGLDLHDRIGPLLIGTTMLARRLQLRLASEHSPDAESAALIVEHLRQCYEQVRSLARSLTESHSDLAAALKSLAERTMAVHRVETRYAGPVRMENCPSEAIDQLYRIAQEAVSNAVRHGLPQLVEIALVCDRERVELSIRDDGIGITPECPETGLGLWSMRYRARSIGGRLEIGPRPDGGTEVLCFLALKKGVETCR